MFNLTQEEITALSTALGNEIGDVLNNAAAVLETVSFRETLFDSAYLYSAVMQGYANAGVAMYEVADDDKETVSVKITKALVATLLWAGVSALIEKGVTPEAIASQRRVQEIAPDIAPDLIDTLNLARSNSDESG